MARSTKHWKGRTDDSKPSKAVRQRSICSVDGCQRYVTGQHLCNAHYRRMRRYGDPLGGGAAQGEIASFLADAVKSETDDCVIWPYGLSNGYGSISARFFGTKYAHIYVCEKVHGARPSEHHVVCHAPVICHNAACINPRHLRWGTQKENRDDTILDRTINRGERCGSAKLTADDVAAIRKSTRPRRDLAKEYGVTAGYISEIRSKRTVWRHI